MKLSGDAAAYIAAAVCLAVFIVRTVLIIRKDILVLKKGYDEAENEYKHLHPHISRTEEDSFDILNMEEEILRRMIPQNPDGGLPEIPPYSCLFQFDRIQPKSCKFFSAVLDRNPAAFFTAELIKTLAVSALPAAAMWFVIAG